ncbi:MAG: SusC/RagA family TonB-linked outer membrane protein [Bacteroidales bacterium]|nr:SusC/RagA family TonB-linked outer membrane protein [Bacteroidales bacterium]
MNSVLFNLKKLALVLVTVAFTAVSLNAQTTVKGKITDVDGEPLIGASVFVKGNTTLGTVTDIDGNYSLSGVGSNAVLTYSYIGYKTAEVSVNGRSTIDVALEADTEFLDEVVMVGYAMGNKRSVSGTVDRVKAEDMNSGFISSPLDAISGKVPGLVISGVGGNINSTPTIRLRGTSSLSGGSDPLVIIDGVFTNVDALQQLAQQDVKEISVLKDASETAQYGSRGAAGVIVVQTNRGEEGRQQVTYNGQFGVSQRYRRIETLSADEYRKYGAGALSSDLGANTDWFTWIQNPVVLQHNHNLAFSQGTKNSTMRASIGVNDRNGLVRGTKNTNYTARFNASQKAFNGILVFELNANLNYRTGRSVSNSVWQGALLYNPTYPTHPNKETGRWDVDTNIAGHNTHPAETLEQESLSESLRTGINGRITVNIIDGLSASVFGSFDYNTNLGKSYTPNNQYSSIATRGSAGVTNAYQRNWMTSAQVAYNKEIGKHTINALALVEAQEYYTFNNSANARGFDTNYFKYNNLQAGADVKYGDVSSSASRNNLLSYMARINYMFDNRYVVTLNARADGSSKLGANHKWGFFPSASAAWIISNEEFMKGQKTVSNLKLRVGYGVTGNQNSISALNSLQMLSPNGLTTYNSQSTVTYAITSNSNPDLKWEMKHTFDVGLDLGMFGGRLRATVDYYRSRTKDLLYNYSVSVPPFTYNTLLANMGEMTNNGIEVAISGDVVRTKDFGLTLAANMAYNQNKLVSLHGTYRGEELTTSKWVTLSSASSSGLTSNTGVTYMGEGYPVGIFRLPVWDGWNVDENGHKTYKLKDIDNDGTVDQSDNGDREILGQVIPKVTANFNLKFNYRKFDIAAQFNGAFGHHIYNFTSNSLNYMGVFPVMNVQKGAPELAIYDLLHSSYYLEKGDYVNIEYITLGYSFGKLGGISNLRLALSCNNLCTITKYSGLTPLINSQSINGGIDARNVTPLMRTFTLQLNLSF